MENKNNTLLLLIVNLVLILLIVIEKVLAVDYFYLNALLVLLLIVAAFLLLFSSLSFITFDLFLGIILVICLAFIGLQKGYGIIFLILAFASIILFLMSIINVSTYRISRLPKPKKPEVIVYGEEEKEKEREKEKREKVYRNFYNVNELVKEAEEFEEAQRYIDEQMKNINEYQETPKQGLKIVTKASSKKKSRKVKVLKKRVKRLPLPFKFVASKTGKNFHDLKCLAVRKIKPKMRVWFKTKKSARKKGFKPCPICLP